MPTVDIQPDETGAKLITVDEASKSRPALAGLTRRLSDEDLKSTGAQKLLLDSLVRVEEENAALKRFQENFHDADKKNAVFEEKLKTAVAIDIFSTGAIAIGSMIVGSASLFTATQYGGWLALVFGTAIVVVGIVAKVIRA